MQLSSVEVGGRRRAYGGVAVGAVVLVGVVAVTGLAVGLAWGRNTNDSETAGAGGNDAPTSIVQDDGNGTGSADAAQFSFEGQGDDVIDLGKGNRRFLVRSTHRGVRDFGLVALDDDLEVVDLVVEDSGPYSGINVMDPYGDAAEVRYIQVSADGPWTVELLEVDQLQRVDGSFDGEGPTVVVYQGVGGVLSIGHVGNKNFAVLAVRGDDIELLVNAFGDYSGRKPLPAGPLLLVIEASGSWTFTVD